MSVLYITYGSFRSSSDGSKQKELEDLSKSFLDDHEIDMTISYFDELAISVVDNKIRVSHLGGLDLNNFNYVIFRNTHKYELSARILAKYFTDIGIKISHKSLLNTDLGEDKILQLSILNTEAINKPDSMFIPRGAIVDYKKTIFDLFSYPFVIKANRAMQGNQNSLIESDEDLETMLENLSQVDLIAQQYVSNDGDYRIFYAGTDKEPLVIQRISTNDEYLNNTSKGAEAIKIDPSDLPDDILHATKNIAEQSELDLSGVDIVQDSSSGEWYFLEINATPAIAQGKMRQYEIEYLAKYLKSLEAK